MADELRSILREAERQGFLVERTKRGHHQVRRPADRRVVATLSGTASDRRSLRNGVAQLRRAGFVWPPRKNTNE